MRPFAKDIQPVVIKGRRKSKLAAPKSKSAAALVKRKSRNARRKQHNSDGTDDLSKEPCQFVPVRRKPLGEYMKLEVPMAPASPSVHGMRMSYAAAVQTGPGVKVMISPRLKKSNKSGGKGKANKITADTKFRIFDEQPKKSHIVRVDPKVFRADVEQKSKVKSLKSKKPIISQKASSKSQLNIAAKSELDDADIIALELKFKRLTCNAAGTATVAAVQTARNLNSIQGNSLAASTGNLKQNEKSPPFVDSVSYLRYHHKRLQQIIEKQSVCAICIQSPEPMRVPQFADMDFRYLEEAALLAQNRTMLSLWLNSDQLIS